MTDLANPLQSMSIKTDNPLQQTKGCKLNFLNVVKGEANLDVRAGSSVNRNLFFLPFSMDVARVIVNPPIDVFEEGCTLWQPTIVGQLCRSETSVPSG